MCDYECWKLHKTAPTAGSSLCLLPLQAEGGKVTFAVLLCHPLETLEVTLGSSRNCQNIEMPLISCLLFPRTWHFHKLSGVETK